MRVAVGADHAGFPIKQRVIAAIEKLGHTVIDRGTHSTDPVDFPDITQATCARCSTGAPTAPYWCAGRAPAQSWPPTRSPASAGPGQRDVLGAPGRRARRCQRDRPRRLARSARVHRRDRRCILAATFDDDEDTRRRVEKLNALDELRSHSPVPSLTT